MTSKHRRHGCAAIALAALATLTLACDELNSSTDPTNDLSPGDSSSDTEVDSSELDTLPSDSLDLTVIPSPTNAVAAFVEWESEGMHASTLQVTCQEVGYDVTVELTPRTDHRVVLLGLVAESSCELTATVSDGAAPIATGSATYEVPSLPEWMPTFDVLESAPESMADGWTLINLTNGFDDHPYGVATIDAEGRVRWYHQLGYGYPGSDTEALPSDDGIFVCATRGRLPFTEIDWRGELVYEGPLTGQSNPHHDCRFLDEEQTQVRYLGDSDGTGCPGGFSSGTIHEVDLATSEETWLWHICDHWTPETPAPDWSHINTIETMSDGNILISSRNQDSLMKVSRETGDVLWVLGRVGDFDMPEGDEFWQQHAPEEQPNGNILLFDNGLVGEREWSRAIEIAYDETTMTAEVVWEFRPDPDVFAPIWSDADRLDNGNTLVTFGRRSETETTQLFEVDADGDPVWHVEFELRWGSYRTDRIDVPRALVIDPDTREIETVVQEAE